MASKARKAFDSNLEDVEGLVELFGIICDLTEGKPHAMPENADVVLRSAEVLLVTYWEAYLEDITAEALDHMVRHVASPEKLPKELRKAIATELKSHKNELAVWELAADGWRNVAKARLTELQAARNRSFNTPKAAQTQDFIQRALGLRDISKHWGDDENECARARATIDSLVERRGQIAHRGKLTSPLTVEVVQRDVAFMKALVGRTGGKINSHISKLTGTGLWKA